MLTRAAQIAQNIADIQARVATAAARVGRPASSIALLAVTHGIPLTEIKLAAAAGIDLLGEKNIFDTQFKLFHSSANLRWHMLGPLTLKKTQSAAVLFDTIQSLTSTRLTDALDHEAELINRQLDVLVEVNCSADKNQLGILPAPALKLIRYIDQKNHLRIKGVMGAPITTLDTASTRTQFRLLSEFFQHAQTSVKNPEQFSILSMGTTNDFEIAVEEGASLIRIKTGIFSLNR